MALCSLALLLGCGGGDEKKTALDAKGQPIVGEIADAPDIEAIIDTDSKPASGAGTKTPALEAPDDEDNKIIRLKIQGMTDDQKVEEVEAALGDVDHVITVMKADPKTQIVELKCGFGVNFEELVNAVKEFGMQAEEVK
jgi:hypothetical protein